MTTSPGTSVPTLFGFSHPISGSCGISGYAHEPMCCPYHCFLGTSTATLFGTALNRPKPAHCQRTAFRTSTAALFGTAPNQPCMLPAHCFDTHFLARSLQLPLFFYANTRAHPEINRSKSCQKIESIPNVYQLPLTFCMLPHEYLVLKQFHGGQLGQWGE